MLVTGVTLILQHCGTVVFSAIVCKVCVEDGWGGFAFHVHAVRNESLCHIPLAIGLTKQPVFVANVEAVSVTCLELCHFDHGNSINF